MIRVKKIGVLQTAKVFGVIYALISLLIVLPFFLVGSMISEEFFPEMADFGVAAFLMIPVMYGVVGFIFTAIACAVYNLISSFTGGIEIEMETANQS